MNQTGKLKDWVIQEVGGKSKAKEADRKNNASSRLTAYRRGSMHEQEDGDGNQSSDHYDPLAGSDDSSELSDVEAKLAGPELQKMIRAEMKEKNNPKLLKPKYWKELVSQDKAPPVDEEGNPIFVPKKELTGF